jgi:hypothetical protein
VGISEDARKRLFAEHNVNEAGDQWIFDIANTHDEAREIEDYFIDALGTDGGEGRGDQSAEMVYAYKKNPCTKP